MHLVSNTARTVIVFGFAFLCCVTSRTTTVDDAITVAPRPAPGSSDNDIAPSNDTAGQQHQQKMTASETMETDPKPSSPPEQSPTIPVAVAYDDDAPPTRKSAPGAQRRAQTSGEFNAVQRNLASHVSSSAATKNTSALSYYNYPFQQYALPECATQQVCNAVYTRLDRINALCACPDKFGDPCSISFASDDAHTIELVTDNSGKALTLIKTCEPIGTVRECRGSRDWSLLALQNVRTGKSHYLVVCRCVHQGVLEGPISHESPPYAKIPGIRVYGMICIRDSWGGAGAERGSRSPRLLDESRSSQDGNGNGDARESRRSWDFNRRQRPDKTQRRRNLPSIPWHLVEDFVKVVGWN